jgi:hypothetical protein
MDSPLPLKKKRHIGTANGDITNGYEKEID